MSDFESEVEQVGLEYPRPLPSSGFTPRIQEANSRGDLGTTGGCASEEESAAIEAFFAEIANAGEPVLGLI